MQFAQRVIILWLSYFNVVLNIHSITKSKRVQSYTCTLQVNFITYHLN